MIENEFLFYITVFMFLFGWLLFAPLLSFIFFFGLFPERLNKYIHKLLKNKRK